MSTKTKSRAFTLIELLIVVSILSILAVIAVPNFMEAQTRARVSRAKADMRTLAIGLESFFADHKRYPDSSKAVFRSPRRREGGGYFVISNELTTPIAYLTNLNAIEDAFAEHKPDIVVNSEYPLSKQYGYGYAGLIDSREDPTPGWLLFSRGPDLAMYNDDNVEDSYDPTNGSISRGNIYRTQRDPDAKIVDCMF